VAWWSVACGVRCDWSMVRCPPDAWSHAGATTNPVVVRGGPGDRDAGAICSHRLPMVGSTITSIPGVLAMADARIPGVDRTACRCRG
jgi:hypothetical protein